MKLQRAIFSGSQSTALELRRAVPLLLSLSIAVGCGGGSSDEASGVGGGTSANAGGEGGTNDVVLDDDEPLNEDGLVGVGATGGSEGLGSGGTTDEAGAGSGGTSGTGSSTGCAALPRPAIRLSKDMETSEGADCGLWALTIVPEGTGNAYVLARAVRDLTPGNGMHTTDVRVVLSGPVVASTCMNDVLLRHVIFAGAGLGPAPFLETSFTVDYYVVSSPAFANVTIDTHLASGAVTCEGALTREPSY
jgi:hypothetical protein